MLRNHQSLIGSPRGQFSCVQHFGKTVRRPQLSLSASARGATEDRSAASHQHSGCAGAALGTTATNLPAQSVRSSGLYWAGLGWAAVQTSHSISANQAVIVTTLNLTRKWVVAAAARGDKFGMSGRQICLISYFAMSSRFLTASHLDGRLTSL